MERVGKLPVNTGGLASNIYTLRGAPVRNVLYWYKQINNALYKFGQEADGGSRPVATGFGGRMT